MANKITTVNLSPAVKDAGQSVANEDYRGNFSAYVESLVKADCKKRGVKIVMNADPAQA